MTVLEVIQDAYETIGYLAKGVALSQPDIASALRSVKMVLGMWGEDAMAVSAITKRSFTLAVDQVSYTIGKTASANVYEARPISIRAVVVRDKDGTDWWVRRLSHDEYLALPDKYAQGRPNMYYYNAASPTGTLYFNRAPAVAETCIYHAEEPISEPSAVSEDFTLSPGCRLALKWELVLELAGKKGMPIDPVWQDRYRRARAALLARALENRMAIVRPEFDQTGPRPPYDILSDGGGIEGEGGGPGAILLEG